jgi:glyoxylase-like metal-dependent hydrolase (beta-lactamase superfamily II)
MRIERVRTEGIFSIDGEDFEVENNIWLLGDDDEVLVVDAAHDAVPLLEAIDGRDVLGIFLTHGHNDHINAAGLLREAVDAPILLHPADRMLWDLVYHDASPDSDLHDLDELRVAGSKLQVLHTPGHSPGGVCLHSTEGHVFGGDTLFKGGPGATGRSYSSFGDILVSIKHRLLTLPPDTVVHTGHGDDTTIGDEAPHYDEWLARGH